eukprot:m.33136 g.33136  ORF g.33136 m.33136 type:complete len:566 (-) comp6435_c0_seq1:43-1740(-)
MRVSLLSSSFLCVFALLIVPCFFTLETRAAVEKVRWMFQRDNGGVISGSELTDDLGPVYITEGDVVTFYWIQYGFAHGLMEVDSQSSFDNCVLDGTQLVSRTLSAEFNKTSLAVGAHYFVGTEGQNCANGLKVTINVLPTGETPPTVIVTTTPVPSTRDVISQLVVVNWVYNVVKDPVEITTDDILQFRWTGNIDSSLRKVTKAAFDTCSYANPLQVLSNSVTNNVVNVTNLPTGLHYFISAEPTHCSSAHMSIVVNVVPRLIKYWITLWPTDSALTDTTALVAITLTGFDDEKKIWLSSPVNVNEASDGNGGTQVLSISSSDAETFEVVTRDVGTTVAVRLAVSISSGFSPLRVRIRPRAENEVRESTIFECSRIEDGDDSTTETAMCIFPAFGSTTTTSSSSNNTQETSCQCYRQLLVHQPAKRVLTCSSEGCFASVDDGSAGWSTVNGIVYLLGTGVDGTVYGVDASNTTVQSPDGGLTWLQSMITPNLSVDAINFEDIAFEEDDNSPSPLDKHVQTSSSGTVDWGITRKGVVVNLGGTWRYRALWSCSCDGTCGLQCDQQP